MPQESKEYYYFDRQGLEGMGVIYNGKPVVFTGISIHTEPSKYRGNHALIPLLKEDFLFFFHDDVPSLNFYAVPALLIIGYDSAGGYFATTEMNFTFRENFPLFYITAERQVYRIKGESSWFLTGEYHWRENLEPSDAVKIYPSRLAAENDFYIHSAEELNLTNLDDDDRVYR